VKVLSRSNDEWVRVEYSSGTGYACSNYMTFTPIEKSDVTWTSGKKGSDFTLGGLIGFVFKLFLGFVCLCIIMGVLRWALNILGTVAGLAIIVATFIYYVTNWPFRILNALQRYLSRPWAFFLKKHYWNDNTTEWVRDWLWVVQVPLYIALAPVRLVCAVYYNLVMHLSFEIINMIAETFVPSRDDDFGDCWWKWTLMLPVRLMKFMIIHLGISTVESVIWTVVDFFLPALTLYHGTSSSAADSIVTRSSGNYHFSCDGHWMVGSGNWAGDGIYFAPARSTAYHYSSDVIIVCRVTTGRTLDLGLAPWRVYRECGNANAHGVTSWGLKNNYVTGLWWRPDQDWWEFCLYDYGGRYNESWRIRPLYVVMSDEKFVRPISGGMRHWLFDEQVVRDLKTTFDNLKNRFDL
jgi:hypothetical protein